MPKWSFQMGFDNKFQQRQIAGMKRRASNKNKATLSSAEAEEQKE